jgi:hypothetical protein
MSDCELRTKLIQNSDILDIAKSRCVNIMDFLF